MRYIILIIQYNMIDSCLSYGTGNEKTTCDDIRNIEIRSVVILKLKFMSVIENTFAVKLYRKLSPFTESEVNGTAPTEKTQT